MLVIQSAIVGCHRRFPWLDKGVLSRTEIPTPPRGTRARLIDRNEWSARSEVLSLSLSLGSLVIPHGAFSAGRPIRQPYRRAHSDT